MDIREKASIKKRLIDANELIKEANADGAYGYVDGKQIADAPTVDAVEVVRCRECKYHKATSVKEHAHCSLTGYTVEYDDFCSCGERKDCSE